MKQLCGTISFSSLNGGTAQASHLHSEATGLPFLTFAPELAKNRFNANAILTNDQITKLFAPSFADIHTTGGATIKGNLTVDPNGAPQTCPP